MVKKFLLQEEGCGEWEPEPTRPKRSSAEERKLWTILDEKRDPKRTTVSGA